MQNRSLSFLTWNLALLDRSASAPLFWGAEHSEAIVRETVLELRPDIVLYQELPGLVPFVETHSMMPANPLSHSGNLATLISNNIPLAEAEVRTIMGCAVLTTFIDLELTIANVHLVPGKGAGPDRLMQITSVIEASPTLDLVIVGDTNMRVSEAEPLLELGFTGTKPPQATWDSQRNRFHSNMPEFSAYFTRWFASPGVAVTDVEVHRDPIEHGDNTFFISDHYALSGTVNVAGD